jgi:hypothetical protein
MGWMPFPNTSKYQQWTFGPGTGAGQIRHRYGKKIQSGVAMSNQ